MDDFRLDTVHKHIASSYTLVQHLEKIIEESQELIAATESIQICRCQSETEEMNDKITHLLEEIVDVQIVIDHAIKSMTDLNKSIPEIVKWMHEYKTARQMVRLLIKDESFGSTKCQAES